MLIALPAFLARTVTVVCLATGAGMLLLVFRLLDYGNRDEDRSASRAVPDPDGGDIESLA